MKKPIQLAGLLLAIAGSAFVLSCSKDYDAPPAKTKTELLTTGSWKRTALISNPAYDWYANGTSDTDILSYMLPCEKDNADTYYANGTGQTSEEATKCDPMDPQTWSFSWAWSDYETKLVFDGFDEYTLLELTETTLKFQSTFVENGVTYTHVETYGH